MDFNKSIPYCFEILSLSHTHFLFSSIVIFVGINNTSSVATPLWPSVRVKPNTCKVGDLKSFGTPECSELDKKAQNTSH